MSRTLGRGLAELFRDTADIDALGETKTINFIKINLLSPSNFQPRKNFTQESLESLAESIKEKGILQPILARKISGSYQIIAGERRWRAAQKAGLTEVPVILNHFSDEEVLETALLENIQREDLNPIEEAEGYERLISEFEYTQDQISKFSGKSRSHIANILRLLALPKTIKDYLINNRISFGHARALIGVTDAETIAEKIIEDNLSVRQTELLIKRWKITENTIHTEIHQNSDLKELQLRLTQKLNMDVKINVFSSKGTGTMQIKFDSLAGLDDIVCKLCN